MFCIGKLVPNKIRDHDNLLLEVILPSELEVERNLQKAKELLAPFILISDHMIINL